MNKVLFPYITWILLLLIPFVFIGFFPSYFSRSPGDIPSMFHVHAFFMSCWVMMAIVQPMLIKLERKRIHRNIGRVSYFIIPIVWVTAYLMIRNTYYLAIDKETAAVINGASALSMERAIDNAAAITMIGMVYLGWFILFYMLAVINRKRVLFHATYMFAAILTILGPSLDRLIYNTWHHYNWSYTFFVEFFVFFFNITLLAALLIYQSRKGLSIKPATVALGIYVIGVLAFFLLPKTQFWISFVELIF